MKDKKQDKQPIVIQETPEMANWMHPQNEERKKLIEERVEELKKRISTRKKPNE